MTLNKKKNGLSEEESDINHKIVHLAYKWLAARNFPRPYGEPPHRNAQRAHENPAPQKLPEQNQGAPPKRGPTQPSAERKTTTQQSEN